MGHATFQLSVVTPERAVLETAASYVIVPAHDGEIGFLRDHAPLLIKLDVGVLRATTLDGVRELYVDGGFAEMIDNRLTVLTEDARATDGFDAAAAQLALDDAMLLPATDAEALAKRERALRRARVQRRLAAG
jgi:F-type H+-transporting ATPase subunit epsilon